MIPNQWYAILESNEIKNGRPVGVTRMAEKLVAWRDRSGKLSIMADRCPHRGVALSVGALKGDCIQCPFHGFEFNTSGACTLIPANGKNARPPRAMKVQSYPVKESNGFVYIWWGEPRETYPPVPFFDSLDDRFVYSTVRDHWNTHYSRAIENQLDVVHLPFIHRSSIGRGNKTLVNGPKVEVTSHYPEDNLLDLWVLNVLDEGQIPLKPSQMSVPERRPFLQFRFPNVWHNWISDTVRVMVAFAPIDHENTMMYLRFYHTVKTPIVSHLTSWFGALGNLMIEREDRRVVITQEPKRSDLGIGEILIQGDGPIITYRKIRRELIEAG